MDISTLAIALNYTNKQIDKIKTEGFKIQVETNRSILNGTGEEKVFYFVPKTTSKPQDGYDEFIYVNNSWEQIGSTEIDLSTYATKDWTLEQISKINKINIADAVVTLEANSFVYDGTPKVPTVQSVVLNGTQLTHGVDYAVVVNPATNAGSYVLSVDGVGDHTGVVAVNWTITKAQATISGDDSISIRGIGESVSKTYTTNGDGTFSFSASGGVATTSNIGGTVTVTSTEIGNGIMTVSVSEGQNYLGVTKDVELTIVSVDTADVFGVVWDYSLSSPELTRLTLQTDPYEFVTVVPLHEPTACMGSEGGQSDFDNHMPWSGMQRYNYVNGEIVDFVSYENGETYVYIPEFWSKIIDDSVNHKMYFYISDKYIDGFSKHLGSDRYIGRYHCDSNYKSTPTGTPKNRIGLSGFRNGISSIDLNHHQIDIHCFSAIQLLFIVEFANLDSQAMVGDGITQMSSSQNMGGTDGLLYHTGRISGTNNQSAIQYRWIENLWGNILQFVDGIIANNTEILICNDFTKYSNSITNDYVDTHCAIPGTNNEFIKNESAYSDGYLFPKTIGGSSSTYVCDKMYYYSGNRAMTVGGYYNSSNFAGIFASGFSDTPTDTPAAAGSRPILILDNGGNS